MPSGPSVGIITLTFSGDMPQESQVIRPIANASPDCDYDEWLTSIGDAWECVDDVTSDGDLSYIYACGERDFSPTYENFREYFEMDDVSLPTGSIIDYVRTTIVIKNLWHWCWTFDGEWGRISPRTGYVEIRATVDDCLTTSSSPSIDLINPYMKPCVGVKTNYDEETAWLAYNYTLTSNPSTGLPWTETTVNDLVIGIMGRADVVTGEDWPRYYMEICTLHTYWSMSHSWVDGIQDGSDSTFLEGPSNNSDPTNQPILYTINDDSDEEWSEQSEKCDIIYKEVKFTVRASRVGAGTTVKFKIVMKHGGNYYYSSEYTRNILMAISNDVYTITTRPWDGQPWEQDDFNPANTEFGLVITYRDSNAFIHVFEFKLELIVEFAMGEVRCTQVYSTVVYHEPTPTPCRLPKPVDIKVNQDIDTQGLNFWSGNREVYALGRSSKRTTLSGIMWDGCTDGTSTCEDIIHCIRALGKLQQPVAVAGLRYADLNTDYNIISFSWKQQLECTNTYDWELELEWCD